MDCGQSEGRLWSLVADLSQLDGWDSVLGFQFENLVLNNYRELLPLLHLNNVLIESAAPYRRVEAGHGLQIDLLLQAKAAYVVVEMKRTRQKVGREVVDEVREKCRRLKHPKNVVVRTALVHAGELARTVESEGYFDAVVSASDLLGI